MLYIYFWPKVSANSTCFALADASRSPLSGALADHQYVHSVRLLHNCMSAHWSRNPEKKPTRPPYAWITCQQSQVETAVFCGRAVPVLCEVAAPIFQQNYGPKTWSAKHWFFILVEHPRSHFNVANNSRANQAQEFCSPKNQRIPAKPSQQRNVTTNPQSNHA